MPAIPFVKLSDRARVPEAAFSDDAAFDLYSAEDGVIPARGRATIGTAVAIEVPAGYCALVLPRSGLASKFGISVLNSPGVVDSGYRGEIRVVLANHSESEFVVKLGDRIAQLALMKIPEVEFIEVESLSESTRGLGGFGHTGR
ncbi:MAG: dUTP diphosphatase [Acidimicrobiaceae bacterium]|nr:dUTP diphosphatase [Acidimicrobiaceae bacterium]